MTSMPPDCCAEPPPNGALCDRELVSIAKALAHPARLAILRAFTECRSHTAGEVVAGLDLAQSTVSEHLRILRDAGLLAATPDPPRTWYRVRPSVLEQFAAQTASLVDRSAHAAE